MNILFVSPRQCWPLTNGARLREYHLARALGQYADLTYVYFRNPGETLPQKADLPFFRALHPVTRPRAYTPGRLIRGAVSQWPLTVVNFMSPDMERTLERACSSKFDIVHMDSPHLAGYEGLLKRLAPGARIFYDWHNIESELLRRYSAGPNPFANRAYARFTAAKMERLEQGILRSASGHVVCSKREHEQLSRIDGTARIVTIENGVDTTAFERRRDPGTSRRLVFVGLMSYHANVDAAVWFTRTVWPLIRAAFPDLFLTIVGADPSAAVLDLRSEPSVEVTGTVPDVRRYYADAFAAVVPLRTGGGTRLKILEAMAAGVPVISTSAGAEGLSLSPGHDLLIADDVEAWTTAVAQLSDADVWRSVAESAWSTVRSGYDWAMIGQRLWATYSDWMKAPS